MDAPNDLLDALDADLSNDNFQTPNANTSNSKYTSVAPVRFSGRNDLYKLPDFLNTIEAQLFARQLVNDQDRISFVGRSLLGPAANWFVGWCRHSPTPHEFLKFITDFKHNFIGLIDPHAVLNAFQKLQEKNVGIDNYNLKFTHLLALMPEGVWTPKAELLFYFRGLQPGTACIVALMHPHAVGAAMAAAVETVSITNRALPTSGYADADGDIMMAAAMTQPHSNYSNDDDSYEVAAFQRGGGRGHPGGGHPSGGRNYHSGNTSRHSKNPSHKECYERNLCFCCYSPNYRFNDCPKRKASNRQ